MKISLVIHLFIILLSSFSYAIDSNVAENIQNKIKKSLQQSGLKSDDLGLLVHSGDGSEKKLIYELNSQQKMIPASISKLATTLVVLQNFSPNHRLKTQLLSDANISNSKLKGSLYLKGAGDPGFVSETMWFLVNHLTRNQITQIEGDLVVDDTLFDSQRYDSSRQEQRVDRAYDSPTGAMSFNWNSINIFIRPSQKVGDPAIVIADPENDYIELVNQVKTVGEKSKPDLVVSRVETNKKYGNKVIVKGTIQVDAKEVVVFKNITQPDYWSGVQLREFLKQRGITVTGQIKVGTTPAKARVLAEAESKPIGQMVADMNKFSNNYVAEMLTKLISSLNEKPATIAGGMKVIQKSLLDLGIPAKDFDMYNPSGLTRDNRMNATTMGKILEAMKSDFQMYPEVLTSLPLAGLDGTLKNRMKNTPAQGWVRAKTGFLTGVVTLAGYAGRRDGTVLSFVFMYNGSVDDNKVRGFFDKLSNHLVE